MTGAPARCCCLVVMVSEATPSESDVKKGKYDHGGVGWGGVGRGALTICDGQECPTEKK